MAELPLAGRIAMSAVLWAAVHLPHGVRMSRRVLPPSNPVLKRAAVGAGWPCCRWETVSRPGALLTRRTQTLDVVKGVHMAGRLMETRRRQ